MFKVQQFENHSLTWWNRERSNIDISPIYQRKGGLWSSHAKAFLIDSIINEFDVPKIYIADFTFGFNHLNVVRKPYAIIDGKQRFEAIYDFFDGKVQLNSDFIYLRDPKLSLANLTFRKLAQYHPEIAAKFTDFTLSVVSVITDEEGRINDLFVRLNRTSLALSGAEVRNAMIGVVPDYFRSIAEHPFFTTNVKFNTMRGQDKNTAAKLLLIEHRGEFVDTKKKQLDDFVDGGNDLYISCIESTSGRVIKVLDQMEEIFLKPDPLLNSPASLVLYYWLIRNNTSSQNNSLRGYLLEFERERRANRQVARESPQDANTTLLLYDTLNRSPDDQQSLNRRYNTLQEGLTKFFRRNDSLS